MAEKPRGLFGLGRLLPVRRKKISKACGFLLLLNSYYASLRPVSHLKISRKWLINKYLKQYFKSGGVFHKPVEKAVENFSRRGLN
jgi:hypothetical protein